MARDEVETITSIAAKWQRAAERRDAIDRLGGIEEALRIRHAAAAAAVALHEVAAQLAYRLGQLPPPPLPRGAWHGLDRDA